MAFTTLLDANSPIIGVLGWFSIELLCCVWHSMGHAKIAFSIPIQMGLLPKGLEFVAIGVYCAIVNLAF